jgi:hypothetical protein
MYFLAVAGVCFLVIGHQYQNRVVVNLGEPFSDQLVKIWPGESPSISYPPELMMDRDFIDLLFLPSEPPPIEAWIEPR